MQYLKAFHANFYYLREEGGYEKRGRSGGKLKRGERY